MIIYFFEMHVGRYRLALHLARHTLDNFFHQVLDALIDHCVGRSGVMIAKGLATRLQGAWCPRLGAEGLMRRRRVAAWILQCSRSGDYKQTHCFHCR